MPHCCFPPPSRPRARPVPSDTAAASPPPAKAATGLVLALVGAIAFSGKAIIVKLAYRYGVDAVTLLMYRMLFALPIFAVMAWWASRGKPPLSRRDWAGIVGLGVTGYYLASFLDFAGLAYITASLERLILYLNPTLVVVLGWLLYGRGIRRGQVLGMAISYCGVVLVFGHEASLQGKDVAWGVLLVFLSAASYAVYLVYSGEMVRRVGSLRLVGLATTVACVRSAAVAGRAVGSRSRSRSTSSNSRMSDRFTTTSSSQLSRSRKGIGHGDYVCE